MNQFFDKHKVHIEEYLREFLIEKEKELAGINHWGKDLIGRLGKFCLHGKMIRGCLIILSYLMFNKRLIKSIVKTASAYELLQSSLLIHDDIMDRDVMRRGRKSIFYQYKNLGEDENVFDSYHFGESLGICAGDIAFYLAFEILSELRIDPGIKEGILSMWSRELINVGLSQMQDVYFSSVQREVSEEDILKLYKYKTARYTFSLPFATGALASGQDQKTILNLERLGEYFGIIFQIKDDELGLFGTEDEMGKSVGTDIEEGKRTLLHHYLSEMVSGEDKKFLDSVLKKREVTASVLASIQKIAEKSGAQERIHQKMTHTKEKAQILIAALKIKEKYKNILFDILEYNLTRKR